MPYGTIKVDNITFTDNSVDKTVSLSGLIQNPTFTGNVTATGTISGDVIRGGTTISGVTVTGTTANFVSGVFTTQLSGATITGTTVSTTTGSFVSLTGTTATFTSGIIASGTAALPSLAILSDPNTGLFSPGADQLAISTNGTSRIVVDASGNVNIDSNTFYVDAANNYVGIGNTSPASELDVKGEIRIYPASGNATVRFGSGGVEKGKIAIDSSSNLTIETAGSERLRITSAGLVGIGTISPGRTLDVVGTAKFSNGTADVTIYGDLTTFGALGTNSNFPLALYTNGTEKVRIDTSGRLLVGTSNSVENTGGTIQTNGGNVTINTFVANSAAYRLYFVKSRSGTFNSKAIVQSGDDLGRISFNGDDGVDYASEAASISCQVDGTPGSDDMPGRLVFSTTLDGASSPTERMRITNAGLVGLGTNSPQQDLHINDATGVSRIRLSGGAANADNFDIGQSIPGVSNSGFSIYDVDATASRLVIDSTGNVGIGTTGPTAPLEVFATSAGVRVTSSNTGTSYINMGDTDSANIGGFEYYHTTNNLAFIVNQNEAFRVDSSRRLLVGMSTARANIDYQLGTSSAHFQVERADTLPCVSIVSSYDSATTSAPAYLTLARAGSTAFGSTTIVADGNRLGEIDFSGSDGTDFTIAASIRGEVDGTPGANDMPGRLVFSTTLDNASSPTERMRITNDGNALLGTTNTATGARLFCTTTSNSSSIYSECTNASLTTAVLSIVAARNTTNGSFKAIEYYNSGAGNTRFFVSDNGDARNSNGVFGAISDVKLKENIVDANSQWNDIKNLQVRNYNFKIDQTHRQIGLIAQEVELVSPGLVADLTDYDREGNDLGTVTKAVNYSVLYMKAVKALQEAMERIETLEASNADMLARVTALEGA